MISISIFRINAKNRTIWYNLIQTSVPLVYTNYFYNIYCPNMGGSRGGGGGGGDRGSAPPPPPPPPPGIARLYVFAMLKFSVRPLLGIWTPPPPPWENFLDPRMPNTIFQNLFFKIITSLANIFSNLFSPREILGFFFISIQVFILFM